MIERVVLAYDDLAAFPDNGLRRELLAGQPFVSPAPTTLHQRLVLQIGRALAAYADEHGGEAFVAPVDVVLTDTDVVEPDVVYMSREREAIVQERGIFGVPSFLIEVVSPGSSEIDPEGGEKYELYATHEVPEYWVVYPRTLRIEAFTEPDAGAKRYRIKTVTQAAAKSLTLPGFEVRLTPRT